MDVIPFSARRFQTAASAYLEGRPPYPARIFERLVQLCGLTRAHRVLDLGCGPGQIALALAPSVGDVVGMDPEPEMLKRAASEAAQAGTQVTWMQGSSYDLSEALGRFHVVTMGRSFHWMDRVETLKRLDQLVNPEGAIVLMKDEHPDVPDNAWHATFKEVIDRYASDDVARQIRQGWLSHEAVLLDSAFRQLESVSVVTRHVTPVDTLVQRASSMSSTARSRLGERADALADELRDAMRVFSHGGELQEVLTTTALIARR